MKSGLYGTCKAHYIGGQEEHNDCILSDAEHAEYLTPCVSHIQSAVLVLDPQILRFMPVWQGSRNSFFAESLFFWSR